MYLKNLLFQNQSLKQTVLKNTFWLFIGQTAGRLLRAVIIIYAARVLGAADWGVFSYAIAIVTLLSVFTDLGINAILTKETARLAPEHADRARKEIISTSLCIKVVMIIISLGILNYIIPFFTNIAEAVALFPVMGLILVFDNIREFGFSITRALEKMEVEAFFLILTNIAVVAASFYFLTTSPSPRQLAYGYIVGSGVGMAATLIYLRRHFYHLWAYFSWRRVRPIFTSAWPYAMLGIMGTVMINTDMILLGWFRPAAELGLYAAAQKPVQALYVLPALLATSLFPALSRLANTDNVKAASIIKRALQLVLAIAIPAAIGGVVFGSLIIQLLFGAAYQASILNWQILIVTLIFTFPGTIIGNAIFAYDRQQLFIRALFIGVLGNVALDLLFIPLWGGPGSAAATLITQAIINIFLWRQLRKINPLIKIL